MAAVEARDAHAQTQLPGIVVTTPSPVVRASPRAAKAPPAASTPAQATPPPPTGIIVEDAFVPITVVPSNEIISTPGANLADSLQYRPGITGSNFAPGANRPVIRGLDNFRVRVQENGIGSHDVSALSEDHAVPIDPFAADHIEVVRGPATLRYGSQAIGGVVNAINDRIPEIIPPRGFSIETRGGLELGGPAAPMAPSRSRPEPATSPCMPTPSSAMRATTTRRRGEWRTRSSTTRASRLAAR